MTLHVSFRGTTHELSLPLTSPLSALQEQLESLTEVPVAHQKLLYKGKKAQSSKSTAKADGEVPGEETLESAGLKDGLKVQLLGPTPTEMSELQRAEAENARRERIMAKRAMKGATKVRLSLPSIRLIVYISIHRPIQDHHHPPQPSH